MSQVTKALSIVVKRLRQDNGLFDIEACWVIGILAATLDVTCEELDGIAQEDCRITFVSWGNSKLSSVKILRTHLRIGLKAAKEIVEGLLHAGASVSVANQIKEECEACGANVIVRPFQQQEPKPTILTRFQDEHS